MDDIQKEALERFKRTGALMTGHFELRSGLHSGEYFQCAGVLRHPQHAEWLCRRLACRLQDAELIAEVIAPALGGIVVGHELARALGVPSLFAEKKPDGSLELRRGFNIVAGRRYLVAEDVITRGGRVMETMEIVRSAGGEVAAVAVIVDRSAGRFDFGVPLAKLVSLAPEVWPPGECPLCRRGLPLDHPGS